MVSNSFARKSLPQIILSLALVLALTVPTGAAERITAMLVSTLEGSALDQAIAAFTHETGIEVDVVEFTSWTDLREKLPTMVAGGISPDVVYHDNGAQSDLYHNGVLQPIEEYVARDNFDLSIWPKPLVDAYRYDGVLYSLPTGVSNWVTFYNADKLNESGLSALPTDWESDGFTFSDLVATARRLTRDTDGDGTPELFGITDFFSRGAQGIHMWGLDWVDDDKTEFLGTSSRHVEAVVQMRELWELGVAGGNWMNGTAVMMPMQPYYLNTISNAMDQGGLFDWSIGILPTVECRCGPAGFHSLGMAAGASNPEGAWEFIKFVTTSSEGAVNFSRAENRTPVVASSIADFYDRWERLNPGMNADVFTSGLNYIFRPNWFGLPRSFFDNLYATMTEIMTGGKDPRVGLEELKPVIDGILNEARENR